MKGRDEMSKKSIFNVNGVIKESTELNLNDLKILFKQFEDRTGKLPVQPDCIAKNNLPQPKIIKNILKVNHIDHQDFYNSLGKYSHLRTESKDFSYYLKKYINICNKLERALTIKELVNNSYGLPSANWFVRNCPDKEINSYDDFILWCGFSSNKLKINDEWVAKQLIYLDKTLNRPIRKEDLTIENIGFSSIVVNRIWGGLKNAQIQLNLKQGSRKVKYYNNFDEMKNDLKTILTCIKEKEHRTEIILKDITFTKYIQFPSTARRYIENFKSNNEDFYKFVESFGFKIATNGNGNCYRFKDNELTKSYLEYQLTTYLRNELNLKYNKDYFRNVRYSEFSNTDKRIDCDYAVNWNGKIYYIEISGMIKPKFKEVWRTTDFKSKGKNEYRDNLILKEQLLIQNDCSFYILFSDDIKSENYKNIFLDEREVV